MAVHCIPGCLAYSIFKSCVKCFSIFYGQPIVYLQARPYFTWIPAALTGSSPSSCIVLHLVLCANKNQLHSNGRFWFICNTYASLALKSNINTKYSNTKCQNTAASARATYLIDCNCNGKERKATGKCKLHLRCAVFLAGLPGTVQAVNKTEFTTAHRRLRQIVGVMRKLLNATHKMHKMFVLPSLKI